MRPPLSHTHRQRLSELLGPAALAARHAALSADHLEFLSADGIAAMAASGTARSTTRQSPYR